MAQWSHDVDIGRTCIAHRSLTRRGRAPPPAPLAHLGSDRFRRPAGRHRGDVPVEHHHQRDGQPVLRRCGAGGFARTGRRLLFGSLDSNNFITVDKPPVSQWVMGLSGQIFGFSSASMLIPEALMAVAAVALLYGAVRRISGPRAALLAGAALALMPVAALMFRYNNPDAVMVLLMMAAAYCAVRALERASAKWIALAGVALGFAFLAKMLEGVMVMPAIGLVYLIAAPTSVRRRLMHLVGAAVAFLRLGGLVRRADAAVAGVVAALHRGFDGQQLHEPGPRLQRIRPRPRPQPRRCRTTRQRGAAPADGQPRGPPRRVRRLRAPGGGSGATVLRRVRLRNRLAAPRRAARRGAGARSRGGALPAPTSSGQAPSCSAAGCWSTDWC